MSNEFAHIGFKIKQLREELGWRPSELAKRADVSKASLNIIENKGTTPSLPFANKIAIALKVPVASLIDKEEKEFDNEAAIFYRQYSDISLLSDENKSLILTIVKRLGS